MEEVQARSWTQNMGENVEEIRLQEICNLRPLQVHLVTPGGEKVARQWNNEPSDNALQWPAGKARISEREGSQIKTRQKLWTC